MTRAPAPPAPRERDLADQVRDAFRQSGLSQGDIARRAKMSPGSFSRFMRGVEIYSSTLGRIAAALNLRLVHGGAEIRRKPGRPPKPRPDPHGWSQMSTDGEG